jgi:hypothetical protein
MPEIILGALALIAILFFGQLFAGANPKALAKALRIAGAVLLGLAGLGLMAMDRVGVGMLLGSMAWGLYTGGHVWPGGWPYGGGRRMSGGGRAGGQASPGQATQVRTDWLELELDHETGAMRGTVLMGRFKGRALERLSQSAAVALYAEAAPQDAETARLLETYLDRTFGTGWRSGSQGRGGERTQSAGSGPRSRARADSGMSRDEAYSVLGLRPGASQSDVRAAHRKLMMQNHPDRGGSDYLAAKINEAKDVLLAG